MLLKGACDVHEFVAKVARLLLNCVTIYKVKRRFSLGPTHFEEVGRNNRVNEMVLNPYLGVGIPLVYLVEML